MSLKEDKKILLSFATANVLTLKNAQIKKEYLCSLCQGILIDPV